MPKPDQDNSANESPRGTTASGERSVAVGGAATDSAIVTGDGNVALVDSEVDGDLVHGDKITNIYSAGVAATALHQLRAPVGDFVGREQEIETLIKALTSEGRAGISGLSGMGGIGKSELALLVAHRLAPHYPDAQLFINLQGTHPQPRRPEEVLAIFSRAFLGPAVVLPEDLDQLKQIYLSQLDGKRVLIVLDNARDSAQVLTLLPPPGCALLVTSREAVTLPGMIHISLNPLPAAEARQLLLEIAPQAESVADQIAWLCGYLPLAIRAAGSLLAITDDLDPAEYAEQLKDEHRRLELIGTKGVEIGVEASFNLSYARLEPEAARVFRQLAIFPAAFDAVAEVAVCVDPGHAHLSELLRRSLVLYDAGTKRYRLHDLARLFADARLSEEERAAARKLHALHYETVLPRAEQLYLEGGEALTQGLALCDLEWENVKLGQAWAAAGAAKNDEAAQLAIAYPNLGANILFLREHSRDHIHWLEAALAAARRLKRRQSEANVLGSLGIAYWDLGETRRAIEFHEQHLKIAREMGDRSGEGGALCNLGLAYADLGETRRTIEFYEQSLVIAREIGDRRGEGNTLGNLGSAYANLGETRQAIELYEQHLEIAREIGDRRGEGRDLGNLGSAYADLGELRRAIEFYEQRLVIAREIGDRRGEGAALGNLGVAHDKLEEPSRAIEFYEQQLTIVREIDDRRGEGTALWNKSLSLRQLGEPAQVIVCAEGALRIYEQIEDPKAAMVREQLAKWREEK